MDNLLAEIKERGYFFQCTDEQNFAELIKKDQTTFYLGFDCTASSLHLGHLVPIMLARLILKFGHRVIVLFGGGTTKVGDPSGKDKTRQMLDQEQITKNVDSITKTLKSFLPGAIFTNNANWLDKINYLDFLRDIGRHFSVNRMLDFESVKLRIKRESHLSFLEFNYMILQAYDFVELNKLYGCKVQIGGSDQWGNIVCGIELARKLKGEQLFGLTVPLIKTASGKKMGKTESGAIWLDKSMCSVYDYWQYFRNVDDNDVERFLRLFTDLKTAEIKKLFSDENCNINTAKKILATKATEICHGKEAAKLALEAAVKEFELNDFSDLQVIKVFAGQSILSIMKSAKIAESNSESKRLIKSGAVKIDGKKIQDVQAALSKECILSAGKKRISIKIAS